AFDAGYELATQWLPWTVKGATEKTGAVPSNSGKNFDWERLPGLLLFRHHFFVKAPDTQPAAQSLNAREQDSMLLVFVVGETPTAGINGYEFDIARFTIHALAPSLADLYIAGPNFSGSFPSMTHLLNEPGMIAGRIQMRSGTVSNDRYAAEMLTELPGKYISFHAAVPPGSSFPEQLQKLALKCHIDPAHTAQIMETETGFAAVDTAQQDDQPSDRATPLVIRYPRNIAQLRNTYNDAAFASSAAQSGTASPPPVNFSLKDTQAGEDEFPTFSTSHTPISQNAVLDQIAQRIKRNRIRLVGLSASNIFDTLFLSNFLRRHCPDTRVVLPSADLLFVEDAASAGLSGLMAISPFPLFPEGTPLPGKRKGRDITTFASSDQAAEFNAVLSLLRSMGAVDPALNYQQGYAPALNSNGIPSAWVLVLSSQGWMPVDWFSQPPLPAKVAEAKLQWWDPARSRPSTDDYLSPLKAGGPLWLTLCAITAFATCALCFRLWHLKLHPENRVWSSFCLEDPDPGKTLAKCDPAAVPQALQILRLRYFFMMAFFTNLAVANALFLCPMLADNRSGIHYRTILVITCVAFCWAAFTSILLVRQWLPAHTWSRQAVALNIGLLSIATCTIGAWSYCCFFNHVASVMFSFRTLSLAGSECPLWPLLSVTLGLSYMAFCQLRRFTWCYRRQPYLDTSLFDGLLKNEFTETKGRLETSLMNPTGIGIAKATAGLHPWLQQAVMLSWPFLLSVLVMFLLGDSLYSFESRVFTYALEALFAMLVAFTLASLFRFFACWKILRAFLVTLNSIVLGRFFEEVSEFAGSSGPIWVRDVKLMSLSTAVNGYIALHNLNCLRKVPFKPGTAEYLNALQTFLNTPNSASNSAPAQPNSRTSWRQKFNNAWEHPASKASERQEFIEAYHQFRLCAKQIAVALGQQILLNYWANNRLDFVGVAPSEEDRADSSPAKPKPLADTTTAEASGLSPEKPIAAAALPNSSRIASEAVAPGLVALAQATAVADRLEVEAPGKSAQSSQTPAPAKAEYEFAARYLALHYSTYIGYVLHQLQNLLVGSTVCFVLLMLGLNSFAFQAPQTIFHLASVSVIIAGAFVVTVLAQMERDPILSRLSGSTGGELGKDFYIRALTFGTLPILTVLGAEFPSIGQYLSTWIQPLSAALH
ncbi:MAG: hypothetical protein JO051_03465, partial [Acidobacteriaceae bacterium]|nr:hypothetical protein [Acidobacteriaceae bacterium]